MSKESKLFSWLGFGKKAAAESEQPEATTADSAPTPAEHPEDNTQAASSAPISTGSETAEPEKGAESESKAAAAPQASAADASTGQAPAAKTGFFARLRQGLSKTSQNLGAGLASLFVGKKIDDELYEELETQLLLADVGVDTTQKLIKQLTQHADRKALKDADQLYQKLQLDMATMLQEVEQPLKPEQSDGPFVILMVGVNGVGKTTTIGKMAQQFKQQGKNVMLAAGDTFRAAAVEQLQVWGERNQIPVVAQHTGADSASVIFDAYQAAKARKADVLIADTAGRLQNKAHLMEELKKIVRVLQKIQPEAPHEVMLTLDAGTGQNALSQARIFNEAVPLTGISLTKLDGTAKGGVIFAIADQFKVPIRYIGVGEGIDDLRTFNSTDFIQALFNKDS
ncbi:signal recognition particle-docking protein FtsY [Alkalimonas delamerensis]|uniref:Signal recognition particle receptor FtsY n=1 Tax=Alkalimonas delamerensis TaxID=265981 RepID=A0ABT9GKS9_9GAMM|nr:signal recognition particle-docking protein FtsY [Alkalimonas delamerensis]MDP4527573.1 signal recognition particle-docking protein FtsY [Alkalimonas delamerensis]